MSKQTILMAVLTLIGCVGSFAVSPFIGLAVYVLYAVLRPQFLWKWSLPDGVAWSFYVALASLVSLVVVGPRVAAEHGRQMPLLRRLYRHLPFFLFGFWIVVTYFTARVPKAGDMHMEEYSKVFIMYTVGVIVLRTVAQAWALVAVYAGALAYISYEINYLYFVNGYLGIHRNGFGGHDNNGAGMLLAMGVPACVFAWEAYKGYRVRWLFLALAPVVMHAVMLTYSRGAMLSMIVTAPFWMFRGRYVKPKLLIGVCILAMVPVLAGKEIRERFSTTAEYQEDESANSRFKSWQIALEMAIENPVFGLGVRNSPLFTFQKGADMEGRVIHSQYLQIAADNGFVGMALYLGTLGMTFWGFQSVILAARGRTDRESERAALTAMAGQAMLVTFCVGAIFLSSEAFEPQYYLILLGMQLPMVYTHTRTDLLPPPVRVVRRRVQYAPVNRWNAVPPPVGYRPPARSQSWRAW